MHYSPASVRRIDETLVPCPAWPLTVVQLHWREHKKKIIRYDKIFVIKFGTFDFNY